MIEFGRDANQLFHTFRHIDEVGLRREDVEHAIQLHIQTVEAELKSGPYTGTFAVKGAQLEYRAYKFENGDIHVGRITVRGSASSA